MSSQKSLPELANVIPSHGELPWHSAFGDPLRQVYCYAGAGGQGTPIHFDAFENLVCSPIGSRCVIHPDDRWVVYLGCRIGSEAMFISIRVFHLIVGVYVVLSQHSITHIWGVDSMCL